MAVGIQVHHSPLFNLNLNLSSCWLSFRRGSLSFLPDSKAPTFSGDLNLQSVTMESLRTKSACKTSLPSHTTVINLTHAFGQSHLSRFIYRGFHCPAGGQHSQGAAVWREVHTREWRSKERFIQLSEELSKVICKSREQLRET